MTQQDIAHLGDKDVQSIVVALVDSTEHETGPLPDFYRRPAVALVRAYRARRTPLAVLELDVMDDERAGRDR